MFYTENCLLEFTLRIYFISCVCVSVCRPSPDRAHACEGQKKLHNILSYCSPCSTLSQDLSKNLELGCQVGSPSDLLSPSDLRHSAEVAGASVAISFLHGC